MPRQTTVAEIEAQADALEAAGFTKRAYNLRRQWLTKDKLGRTVLAKKPITYKTEADIAADAANQALAELEAREEAKRRADEARVTGKAAAREALQAIAAGRVESTKDEVYDLVEQLEDDYYDPPTMRFTVKRPSLV